MAAPPTLQGTKPRQGGTQEAPEPRGGRRGRPAVATVQGLLPSRSRAKHTFISPLNLVRQELSPFYRQVQAPRVTESA